MAICGRGGGRVAGLDRRRLASAAGQPTRRRSRTARRRRSPCCPAGRARRALRRSRRAFRRAPEKRSGARTGGAISTEAAIAPAQSSSPTRVTAAGRWASVGRGEDGERDARRRWRPGRSRRSGSCCWSRRRGSRAASATCGAGSPPAAVAAGRSRRRGAALGRRSCRRRRCRDDRGDDEDDGDERPGRRAASASATSAGVAARRLRLGRLRSAAPRLASPRRLRLASFSSGRLRCSSVGGTSALIGRFGLTAGNATRASSAVRTEYSSGDWLTDQSIGQPARGRKQWISH